MSNSRADQMLLRRAGRLAACSLVVAFTFRAADCVATADEKLCRIEIRDQHSDWPVPLVELRTVHHERFISDNSGVIAFDLPECFDRETFFTVEADGYELPADGFGFRGVRLVPRSGQTLTVRVQRTSIAKRLGRLTGQGLFAEAQRFGERADWREGPLMGCDSVQMVIHRGRPFWSWGDTQFANYPLGNFDMSGATTRGAPVGQSVPPIAPQYDYFLDDKGRTKRLAPIAGKGPTWLSGYASLKDSEGRDHLVALYRKIQAPMTTYEIGLCEWDADRQIFTAVKKLWCSTDGLPEPKLLPSGHPVHYREPGGARNQAATEPAEAAAREWLLFGDPLPKFRCPATYEAWLDSHTWQAVDAPKDLADAHSDVRVQPHSGSIAWHPWRKRWVCVFMQAFGQPSAFGELWYAEADEPLGPWGKAVKVLSHRNYTFYNPRLWGEFATADSPLLLFEGTYTEQFSKANAVTPRYDYNQILYRIDLDAPQLAPAQALLPAE